MVLSWRSYRSDLDRVYPMFALSVRQINPEIAGTIDPLTLLPDAIASQIIDVDRPCAVGGLTARTLVLWALDGGQYRVTYPQPFSQNLYDYLTLNSEVQAFEFVGERLKYGRLRRLLDRVGS